MSPWSAKYGRQPQLLTKPNKLDIFIAGTQAPNNAGSAHALQIQLRNSDELILHPQAHSSKSLSRQERACLSAIVWALQAIAPGSDLRVICRLENVVEALNGRRKLIANADILREVIELRGSRTIDLSAQRPDSTAQDAIIERLLQMSQEELRGRLAG